MLEKENVLRILNETKESIKNQNVIKLKELSNQTIHSASISQDPDNIAVAVIIYSIGKILERQNYKMKPGWEKFHKNLALEIDTLIDYLKKNEEKKFSETLQKIRNRIGNVSGNLKKYIQDVLRKASINKASKIYEHGISLEKTAKLLGITMWELSNYAGQTWISDMNFGKTMDVKQRIKLAMEMFE